MPTDHPSGSHRPEGSPERIGLGADHAGFHLKSEIGKHLRRRGYDVVDFGHHDDSRADYPVYGRRVAEAVAAGEVDRGVVVCGTGVGIAIAANKVRGIRAACCSEPYSAALSRQHNNANILALGARVVGRGLALAIVDTWLGTDFDGGRHTDRLALIDAAERDS